MPLLDLALEAHDAGEARHVAAQVLLAIGLGGDRGLLAERNAAEQALLLLAVLGGELLADAELGRLAAHVHHRVEPLAEVLDLGEVGAVLESSPPSSPSLPAASSRSSVSGRSFTFTSTPPRSVSPSDWASRMYDTPASTRPSSSVVDARPPALISSSPPSWTS